MKRRRRSVTVATLAIGALAAQAFAHGGMYQPPDPPAGPGAGHPGEFGKIPYDPPPPPPPPPPRAPPSPGAESPGAPSAAPGGGPTTGGGGGGGPVTGGGGGPAIGGAGAGGPATGGGPGKSGGGGEGSGAGPTTGGGGGGGPATPGNGTGTGGESPAGPSAPTGRPTGPQAPGGGPTTGGGGGPLITDPHPAAKPKHTGGTHPDHWTRWWYANRLSLIDLHGRVRDRQVATPSAEPSKPTAELWRAQAQEALTLALSDSDDDVSSGAAIALGKAGDPEDAAQLAALLGNARRGQQAREGAALALGLLPPQSGGTDVRAALEVVAADDQSADRLRSFAVYALGLRGDAAAVPFLLDAAKGAAGTWTIAAAGASALGLSRCGFSREDLERMLAGARVDRQRDTIRRVYAAHGLARLGDAAAVSALRNAGLDDDADVRRAAVLALGVLAPADDGATTELLVHLLHRDKDRACRNMAAISLARIGAERAAHELRWAYDNGDALTQPFAAIALGLVARRGHDADISKLLRHDLEERANSDLRGALCIAVGLCGDLEAAPVVRKLAAERGDPDVRAQAAMALGLLGDRDGGPPVLRSMLRDAPAPAMQREAALALGMLGDREAVKILLDLVCDGGSVYVQGSAAIALGRIGGEESTAALCTMLKDKGRPGIARGMAAVSLGLLLDRTEGRRLASIGADLDWYALTPAAQEILDIL